MADVNSSSHRWMVLLAAVFLGMLVGLQYLFRSQIIDNPEIGRITYSYRFGKPYEITVDVNRDGRDDCRGLLRAPFGPASTHTIEVLELWEDYDLDGNFEYHVILEAGVVKIVEIDADGDDHYEKTLVENEAANFFTDRISGRGILNKSIDSEQE